mgnify:CR=1 FL=1
MCVCVCVCVCMCVCVSDLLTRVKVHGTPWAAGVQCRDERDERRGECTGPVRGVCVCVCVCVLTARKQRPPPCLTRTPPTGCDVRGGKIYRYMICPSDQDGRPLTQNYGVLLRLGGGGGDGGTHPTTDQQKREREREREREEVR